MRSETLVHEHPILVETEDAAGLLTAETPIDTMHVTRLVGVIRWLERKKSLHQRQMQEAERFYRERIEETERRSEEAKQSILNFLSQEGLKNLRTPNGTVFVRKHTARTWPDDKELVQWTEDHLPSAIRIKKECEKRMVLEHIRSGGDTPDGFSEHEELRLGLR